MMQADIRVHGIVLPETRDRVRDEELSYLAEGVDRAARTEFALQRDEDGTLVYFDRGEWRPYMGMLATGLEVAQAEAAKDYRRQFLAEWSARDLQLGYRMQALKPGEQFAWHSSFPHEQAAQHGDAFMMECGLNPKRRMGFLYRARCDESGAVVLESQTVDRSDPQAFEAAQTQARHDPQATMDTMLRAYDGSFALRYGKSFYAGRSAEEAQRDVWEFIKGQQDLVEYFLQGIETIAGSSAPRQRLERMSKEHVYGVWALFKKRLDGEAVAFAGDFFDAYRMQEQLHQEVMGAFNDFVSRGEVLIGCGGSIDFASGKLSAIMGASGEMVFGAIFGGSSFEEKYSFSKRMFCVVCQAPPKQQEKTKLCGPCGICRICDSHLKKTGKG